MFFQQLLNYYISGGLKTVNLFKSSNQSSSKSYEVACAQTCETSGLIPSSDVSKSATVRADI